MSNLPLIFWFVPFAAFTALGFSWYFYKKMIKEVSKDTSFALFFFKKNFNDKQNYEKKNNYSD